MGFEFEKHEALNICGKTYFLDVTDVSFIDAVANDFAQLLESGERLKKLKADLIQAASGADKKAVQDATSRLTQFSAEIAESCRNFIVKSLGQKAFDEIFRERQISVSDYIDLCGYIYAEALKQRQDVLKQYINPPAAPCPPNHKHRRRKRHVPGPAGKIDNRKPDIPDRRGFPALDGNPTAVSESGSYTDRTS